MFVETILTSGLINTSYTESQLRNSFSFEGNAIKLKDPDSVEQLAQIIADFLRKHLLKERRKFSFETVFSHPSKLDIIREATEAGYKVYLYFVSTESPEINKYRVNVRVKQGGHSVPENKIESRYYRSLDLLYDAAQLVYQAYFFDNSNDGSDFKLFAHFKKVKDKKEWDPIDPSAVPNWFVHYYSEKARK
jgi:predicted ABC-type ATPase